MGVRPLRPLLADAEQLARRLLHLRVLRAAGNAKLRTRFQDAQAGGAHAGIHALRLCDQRVQHGVVEMAPPSLELGAVELRRAGNLLRAFDEWSQRAPFQSASQGTCGCLKSGPTVVQAPSTPAAATTSTRIPKWASTVVGCRTAIVHSSSMRLL